MYLLMDGEEKGSRLQRRGWSTLCLFCLTGLHSLLPNHSRYQNHSEKKKDSQQQSNRFETQKNQVCSSPIGQMGLTGGSGRTDWCDVEADVNYPWKANIVPSLGRSGKRTWSTVSQPFSPQPLENVLSESLFKDRKDKASRNSSWRADRARPSWLSSMNEGPEGRVVAEKCFIQISDIISHSSLFF